MFSNKHLAIFYTFSEKNGKKIFSKIYIENKLNYYCFHHILDKCGPYAMVMLEQLKNAINTKWRLTKKDMLHKTIVQLKRHLYVVSKEMMGLVIMTSASLYSLKI